MRLNVGDLAIQTASVFYPNRIGQICTIVEPYRERLVYFPDGRSQLAYRYIVRYLDGETGAISFRNLKPLHGDLVRENRSTATVPAVLPKGER